MVVMRGSCTSFAIVDSCHGNEECLVALNSQCDGSRSLKASLYRVCCQIIEGSWESLPASCRIRCQAMCSNSIPLYGWTKRLSSTEYVQLVCPVVLPKRVS